MLDASVKWDRLPPWQWFPMLMLQNRTSDVDRRAWFTELGRGWLVQGGAREHNSALSTIPRTATRAELDLAMTPQERAAFADLPDELTVYRGATEFNVRGVAWTLNRGIARALAGSFARPGDPPPQRRMLLTGRVRKTCGFIKLWQSDGVVVEVVAPDVGVIETEEIERRG